MTSAAEYLGTYATGSPEWHAARATGLGGSEIAAVLGLSPWESPFSLWHRKAGLAAPQAMSDEMAWGHYLEAAVAEHFAEVHPTKRVRRTGTWRSKARPWQLANPDRLVSHAFGRSLLEIKTARTADGWGEPGTDDIPVYYRTQVLWYLDALGLDTAYVAVLIAGSDYREYVVEYDLADAMVMREAAVEFLDSLTSGKRPSIDAHDATYQVIRQQHPDIDDVKVQIAPELAERYCAAVAAFQAAEAVKQQVSAEVLDALGSGRRAMSGETKLAMRVPSRGGITLRSSLPSSSKGIAA